MLRKASDAVWRTYVAAHCHPVRAQLAAMDMQWRKAGNARVIDPGADRIQRVDQVADRPFVHPCDTVQFVVAAHGRQGRGQRPNRSTCVAHVQVGLLDRKTSGASLHGIVLCARRLLPDDAQLLQRRQHDLRVVGCQQIQDFRAAIGQRGQQQSAVGNAF